MSTINNLIPSVQNADDVFGEQELEQELEHKVENLLEM